MRILSQDGRIDVPYEMVGINIWGKENPRTKTFCVYAHSNSLNMREGIMAQYSSLEKSEKAMEILRDAYMTHNQYNSMTEEQKALFIASASEKEQQNLYGVFQFSADEEIEV